MSEDGSSAEVVTVQLYGPATQLSCVLDGEKAFIIHVFYSWDYIEIIST